MYGFRGVFASSVAGLLLGSVVGCREAHRPSEEASVQRPPVAVSTAPVESSTLAREVWSPGTVVALERAALSARIMATVVALPFEQGDPVKRGDLLVRLDDAALASSLKAAESGLETSAAELRRLEALAIRGAATAREVEMARAQAAAARAQVQGARDQISYALLRAPFDGFVAERMVHVGDVAAPGQPLLSIEGAGGLEVRATIDAASSRGLETGRTVAVLVDGFEERFEGTVRSVSGAGDPATHRFEVRASLPDTQGLRSGLFARIAVPSSETATRLLVPDAAILERGGLTGVFVVEGGVARLRYVAPGDSRDGRTEVRAGLAPDERVALDPGHLEDGVPVKEEGGLS